MTPESAFDTVDVDHITRMFAQSMKSGPNGFFVFNCQIGRGKNIIDLTRITFDMTRNMWIWPPSDCDD